MHKLPHAVFRPGDFLPPSQENPISGLGPLGMLKCCFKILSEVYVASSTKSKKIPDLLWEEFHLIQLDTHLIIY